MTEAAEDMGYYRSLAEMDWLVTKSWNRLHHAALSDDELLHLLDQAEIPGPIILSCGRTAALVAIPGVFTRMGAPRCTGCGKALGYPQGKGSPKNDGACRAMLGLDDETKGAA
jgi:hypothetical protein